MNIRQVSVTASLVNAVNTALSDSAQVTIVISGAGQGGDLSNAKVGPVPFKANSGDPGMKLLVLGATAVIQHARPGRPATSQWLLNLLSRKPRKLAAVALANKMARIVWAMMTSGEAYRPRPVVA